MLSPGNHDTLNDRLRQIIAEDRDGIFQARSIGENYPDVNFQDIALGWIDGKSWNTMVAEFGIPSERMLKNFYHQSIRGFRSYLIQRLEE